MYCYERWYYWAEQGIWVFDIQGSKDCEHRNGKGALLGPKDCMWYTYTLKP